MRGSDGRTAPNPLFSGGFRDSSLILVAGIVGVPKVLVQDGDKPKALTSADWEKIISPDLTKRDPHMIESIGPRTGVPRFAGDRTIDPVNGGDRDVPNGDDLQYACITPRATSTASDCASLGPDAAMKNPLCDSSTKQTYDKAYPGLRHLRTIERLGTSGFVASICNTTFTPAIQGIVEKVRRALNGQCVRQIMTQDEATDNVGCNVVEVFKEGTFTGRTCETLTGAGAGTGYCTPGSEPCRRKDDWNFPPYDKALAALQLNLPITVVGKDGTGRIEHVQATVEGANVVAKGSDGRVRLVCEHRQLAGGRVDPAITNACLNDPTFKLTSGGGFCYSTAPAVVGDCTKQGAPSTLRFLGDSAPKDGSEVFSICHRCGAHAKRLAHAGRDVGGDGRVQRRDRRPHLLAERLRRGGLSTLTRMARLPGRQGRPPRRARRLPHDGRPAGGARAPTARAPEADRRSDANDPISGHAAQTHVRRILHVPRIGLVPRFPLRRRVRARTIAPTSCPRPGACTTATASPLRWVSIRRAIPPRRSRARTGSARWARPAAASSRALATAGAPSPSPGRRSTTS